MGGGVSKRRAAYVKRQVGERVAKAGESAAESAARWAKEDEEARRQEQASTVVQALCRTRFALKAAEHRRAVRAYHMQVRLAAWVRQWQQRRRFIWAKSRAVLIQRRVRRGWGGTEGERRPPGHERPWRKRTAQSRWQWWDVQGAEVEEDPEQQYACGRIAGKLEALWTPGARAGFAMDERDLLKLVREAHQEGVHGFVNPDLVLRRAEAAVKEAEKGVKRAETMMEVASTDAEKVEAKSELAEALAALQAAKDRMPRFDGEDEDENDEWNDEVENESDDGDTPAPIPADEVDVPRELILREEDKAWRAVCYQDLPRLAELVGTAAIECRALNLDGQRDWWRFERTLRQLADTEPGSALRQACLELYWWLYLELPLILRDCPDNYAKQLEARCEYLKLLRTIPRLAPETRQLTVTGYGTNAALHGVLTELEEVCQGMKVRLRQEEEERRKRRSASWMNPPTVFVVRWWRTVRGAAIHLQAAWRQHVATCAVQLLREERAALWLQCTVRMYNVKRRAAFRRFMVLPHVARTEAAMFIQRAYRRKRALERWEVSRHLPIQWGAAIKVQALFQGWAVRKKQQWVTQDVAHRVLRILKKAGLPGWEIWPRYAKTGLTYDRFLKLAELPGHQLGGEVVLDELKEQAAAALIRQQSVVKERLDARAAHLQRLQSIFTADGWNEVRVAGTLFSRGPELHKELLAGPILPKRKKSNQKDDSTGETWLSPHVEKKMRSTHPYGVEKDGEFGAKRPPAGMDLYEEVAWLKRQDLAKKEWYRLQQERLDFANRWVGQQIEKRMHGTYQYGVPEDQNECPWHYQRLYMLKPVPDHLGFYERAAWLKKQKLAKSDWEKIQEEAAERRRAEETRLKEIEQSANEPESEPEPEPVKKNRWKKMADNAISKGTVSGIVAAASARKYEHSRRLIWGIQAADRYRLATVLRDERPAWEKKKRAQAKFQLGLIADRNRIAATRIQAVFRSRRVRKQLRHAGEQTDNQIRHMFDRIGVGRHTDKFVRFGFGFEQILAIRENQLGEERGEVQKRYAMAAWGMAPSERQRVMGALPVEKAKWDRSKKMVLMRKSKAQRQYNELEIKVKAVFDTIDTDGSGEIDKAEFNKLMVALGIGMSAKQLNEAWRWMDKDRGGALDFEEFFRWWKANRDGAEQRGFIAGGGLSQNAEQSVVSDAKSISTFQAMFDEQSLDGAALTGAVERMREEQRNSRPLPLGDVGTIKGDGYAGKLRWSSGGTQGSNVVLSNASTLAYMSAHGGHLNWKNPKDISVPGQKWCPPKQLSERGNPLRPNSANLSEWIGGANETRRQAVAEQKGNDCIPVNPRVKVGRMVRVLWEETARAAVERCSAIETGWTDERAARCGHEGEVRQVDPDGTCRIHFPPQQELQTCDDNIEGSRIEQQDRSEEEMHSAAGHQQRPDEEEHAGFGYGASVVKLANDAVKAAAAAKAQDKEARALRRRIKHGDALREEALWFPVDAVEPTLGDYSSDEDDRPDASTAYALVASGTLGVSRVVGYEISGCKRQPQLNGSYDIGRMDHSDEAATPDYRQTTGEHWLVWRKVGYGGGQWFIGEAIGLRPGAQGGTPGGANMAFSLGPSNRPAPRDGWFVSKVPTGNGAYVPEETMVVRALLADDGAVKAISEVSDENVRQNWIEIGAATRRECTTTLRRLGCLGVANASRPPIQDPVMIAAVEDCRNRLRQAGEVAQSFGDAKGWAGCLNLQAECCAALGKERLVGALKLKARGVLESAPQSVNSPPSPGGRVQPTTASSVLLPMLGANSSLNGPTTSMLATQQPRPATAVTGRPSAAPVPTPVETLIPPPPPQLLETVRPLTADGAKVRRRRQGLRPRTADGMSTGESVHGNMARGGSKRRRPRTAQQLQQAYQTLPSAVPTMIW